MLPEGWSIERIEEMGVSYVRLLDPSTYVVEDRVNDLVELRPQAIVDCGGLCLVWDSDDDNWHMGQVDDDGSIVCWGAYGTDLGEAVRHL